MLCVLMLLVFGVAGGAGDIIPNNCTIRDDCDLHQYLTNTVYQNCRCDDRCALYKDCCFNAEKQSTFWERRVEPSCKKVTSINWWRDIHIVDTCPTVYSGMKVAKQCEIDLSKLISSKRGVQPFGPPVPQLSAEESQQLKELDELFVYLPVSSKRTGMLFKNVYCGMCNGVFNVDFWSVKLSQRVPFPENVTSNMTELAKVFDAAIQVRGGVTFQSDSYSARTCKRNLVDGCDPSWKDRRIARECNGPKSFTSYMYYPILGTTYRNKFCAQCSFINESSLSCYDFRIDPTGTHPYRPFPFSVLLDINRRKGAGDKPSDEVGFSFQSVDDLCEDGHIYNPMTKNCESLICDFALGSESPEAIELLEKCGYLNSSGNASAVTQYELVWKFGDAQGYITLVANTLSMCGLVVQLIIYSLIPSLRNIPGKCLMCLSSSLLFAQFFFTFLIGLSEPFGGCVFIAAVTHFSFLAYFCWMNIMAFDIWRAFNHQSFQPQESTKKLIYYSVYGWLAPGSLVALSIILDQTDAGLKPDYARNFCWFGNRTGLLVLFAVPLAVITIADCVLFALTVMAIKKASEGAKLATKKERSQFSLYVKLASIMGLTWISGFLAALTEVTALWYIFIILNSSQGVFICVSFCCTKKVIRLLSEKLDKYKRKQSVQSSNQTELTKRSGSASPMILDKHGLKGRSAKI